MKANILLIQMHYINKKKSSFNYQKQGSKCQTVQRT